ncbi:hypothetical protein [Massilia sp. CCM 8734]|uniref:hypothetical protein n=1 Tax=Massilia sp. CCM 8734 TaxID=2609283 RepID=UPI0014245F91|nr:hypothetical protein [Massilia sp. CCM 8734]NHZ94574.1 hypothetical protein [Massilia sp. CCM 8734]
MTTIYNPLDIFARKQKVGADDTRLIAMPAMIHLDAAKRGQCTASGANFLTQHLIIASFIAARTKSKAFHGQVTKAYAALQKASARPTKLLDLTTGEHKAIAAAIKTYLCAMPNVEVGVMNDACKVAERAMQ